ncbi:hypothetical protein GCM10027035_45450 [Emticicia sediminis]
MIFFYNYEENRSFNYIESLLLSEPLLQEKNASLLLRLSAISGFLPEVSSVYVLQSQDLFNFKVILKNTLNVC